MVNLRSINGGCYIQNLLLFIYLFRIYAPKVPYPSGQVFQTVSDSKECIAVINIVRYSKHILLDLMGCISLKNIYSGIFTAVS